MSPNTHCMFLAPEGPGGRDDRACGRRADRRGRAIRLGHMPRMARDNRRDHRARGWAHAARPAQAHPATAAVSRISVRTSRGAQILSVLRQPRAARFHNLSVLRPKTAILTVNDLRPSARRGHSARTSDQDREAGDRSIAFLELAQIYRNWIEPRIFEENGRPGHALREHD